MSSNYIQCLMLTLTVVHIVRTDRSTVEQDLRGSTSSERMQAILKVEKANPVDKLSKSKAVVAKDLSTGPSSDTSILPA